MKANYFKQHQDWIGELYSSKRTIKSVELWLDGKFHSSYSDPNAAFAGLLRVQPFSTYYATRWGGWKYKYIYEEN